MNLLLLMEKKEEEQNGHFCREIYSTMVRQTSRVASQYTSEADLSESLWLDRTSRFAHIFLYLMYMQADILNHYIQSCYRNFHIHSTLASIMACLLAKLPAYRFVQVLV